MSVQRAVAEIWSRHLDSAMPLINAAVFQEARTETKIVDLDQLLKKLKASVVVSLLLEVPIIKTRTGFCRFNVSVSHPRRTWGFAYFRTWRLLWLMLANPPPKTTVSNHKCLETQEILKCDARIQSPRLANAN